MNRLLFSIPLPTFSGFTISIFLFFFSFSAAAQCGCTDCRCSDSLALVALYDSTNGANWTNKWVLTQPMTTWYGITLTNGRVTCIDLDGTANCSSGIAAGSGNNLNGTIPNFNLPNLQSLYLSSNQLSGTIPNFNLPNLQFLLLSSNQLSGTIPNFNLPNLQFLWLYSNQLSGTIPNFNLPNLQSLNLSLNQLSGTIPNFNLPNLQFLWLHSNQLSGTIPNFNLPNLKDLNLSSNQLSGTIPNFNLPNLTRFSLYSNKFTFNDVLSPIQQGTKTPINFGLYAPQDSIFKDTIYQLTEGGNLTINLGIDDTVTTNIYKWYKNNVFVDSIVGNNKRIFTNLRLTDAGVWTCRVTNPNAPLLTLYSRKATVLVNQSCRSIDSAALVAFYNASGGTTNWQRRDNWRTANPINTWYGVTVNTQGCVTAIRLENNGLKDSLTYQLGNISNLAILNVNYNQIRGGIPIELSSLSNLQSLELSYNGFNGNIPKQLGNLSALKILNLSGNSLTGGIPKELGSLSNLDFLLLGINPLGGTIPIELSNLRNLTFMYLSLCQLRGGIPTQFGALSKLINLQLDGNYLDGAIPKELGSLSNLEVIGLTNNQFKDSIPSQLGNLMKLKKLGLSQNQLTGEIPSSFQNLRNLNAFFFETNKIDKLPNLSILPFLKDTTGNIRGLRSQNNKLTFKDIVPNISLASTATLIYNPQDSIYKDTTINLTTGSTVTIDLAIDAGINDNKYVWFKNGIRFDSSNVNKLILKGLVPCDAATYTVQVTNPAAPLLTLYSRKAKVVVTGNIPMPSVDTTICNNKSYRLPSGRIVTIAGTYKDTLRNIRNCDSLIVTTRLTISPKADSTKQTPVLCTGQTYTLPNGQIISSATNYRDTVRTRNGCDSLIRIVNVTTSSNPTTTTLNASICRGQSYTLPNSQIVTPSVNTIYRDTLKSLSGCDSVRRITTITVNSVNILATQNIGICLGRSMTLPSGRILTPNAAMTLTDTVRGRTGCDSLIQTFNISVSPAIIITTQTPVLCNGQTYTLPNGQIVSTATNYRDTVRTLNGCDSLIRIINVTTGSNPTTKTLNASICRGQNYTLPNGQIVTPSVNTTYLDTLKSISGCDSLRRTTIVNVSAPTVLPTQNAAICSGQNYTLPSGRIVSPSTTSTFSDTIRGRTGCDSLIRAVNLTVNQPTERPLSISICSGQNHTLPKGRIVSVSGIYRDTFRSVGGCDSVVVTTLTVNPPTETPLTATICSGQTHLLPSNKRVSISGIYRDTFKNAQGCNTVIVTTLTVTPPIVTPLSINLFEGDSFRFKGRIIRTSGVYRDSFRTAGGCDSIVEANMSFKPIVIDESCLEEIKNAIPNAFSPNDDGDNDLFDPQLYFTIAGCPPNLKAERLLIVSQWGEIIWEANPYRAWNGHSGKHQKPVPESAYFYVLVLRVNGKDRMIRGAINVFTDK